MSLRFNDIEAFLNVAGLNSVTSAAERMNLSESVISKRVSGLGRRLGIRLLYHTTRNVESAEAGHFFCKTAEASLQELNSAAEIVTLRENDLCGELRIVTPMSLGTLWLLPVIADFMSQCPRPEIVLQMDDRLTDFEEEGYDLSIRVTRLDDSSLIARPLANSQRVVRYSPDYAERHGTLDTLEQLVRHECLDYNNATPSQVWTFEPAFPGAKPRAVSPHGQFSSDSDQAMRDVALRGQGLALLPLFIVAEDLKNGRLVDATSGLRPPDDVIYAMYPRVVTISPKVKAFVQHLQQALSIPPWGNGWTTEPFRRRSGQILDMRRRLPGACHLSLVQPPGP